MSMGPTLLLHLTNLGYSSRTPVHRDPTHPDTPSNSATQPLFIRRQPDPNSYPHWRRIWTSYFNLEKKPLHAGRQLSSPTTTQTLVTGCPYQVPSKV
jgi:hypothetical protein